MSSNHYCLYLLESNAKFIEDLLYLMNIKCDIVYNSEKYDFTINGVSIGDNNYYRIFEYIFKDLDYEVKPPIENGYTLYLQHRRSVVFYGDYFPEVHSRVEKKCKELNIELKTMFFIDKIPINGIPTDFDDYSVLVDPKGNVFVGKMDIYLHLREMENNNLYSGTYYEYINPNSELSSTVCWVKE